MTADGVRSGHEKSEDKEECVCFTDSGETLTE